MHQTMIEVIRVTVLANFIKLTNVLVRVNRIREKLCNELAKVFVIKALEILAYASVCFVE